MKLNRLIEFYTKEYYHLMLFDKKIDHYYMCYTYFHNNYNVHVVLSLYLHICKIIKFNFELKNNGEQFKLVKI